jgi:hypothetical protein
MPLCLLGPTGGRGDPFPEGTCSRPLASHAHSTTKLTSRVTIKLLGNRMGKKRGRPKGERPAKSAAQRMREFRARRRRRKGELLWASLPQEMRNEIKPFPPEFLAEIDRNTAAMMADVKPFPPELLAEIEKQSAGMFEGVPTAAEIGAAIERETGRPIPTAAGLFEAEQKALRGNMANGVKDKP